MSVENENESAQEKVESGELYSQFFENESPSLRDESENETLRIFENDRPFFRVGTEIREFTSCA